MSHLKQSTPTTKIEHKASLTRGILQRAGQVVGMLVLYGILLFVSAGRLVWPAAWIFLAVGGIVVAVNSTVLLTKNPEFVAARGQVRHDAKDWDKRLTAVAGVCMLAGLVVPGLDLRFKWSSHLPVGIQLVGFVVLIIGYGLFSWAMISNEFFETGVRLQTDRGQTVATRGPYGIVRHPGYVGMILQLLSTPFALASWWGLIPAVCASLAFAVRTALEDRMLQEELPGYKEYAQRVPHRLVPRVW